MFTFHCTLKPNMVDNSGETTGQKITTLQLMVTTGATVGNHGQTDGNQGHLWVTTGQLWVIKGIFG